MKLATYLTVGFVEEKVIETVWYAEPGNSQKEGRLQSILVTQRTTNP